MIRNAAFTLVEILIVVMTLGILAMAVVPRYISASNDARESSVCSDIQTIRSQIEVYKVQHGARGPHVGPGGSSDTANMVARLMGKTDENGKLDGGTLGPYIRVWPANPFASGAAASSVAFGAAAKPTRNGATGWYYGTDTCAFSANTSTGGMSLDPPAASGASDASAKAGTPDAGPTDMPIRRF